MKIQAILLLVILISTCFLGCSKKESNGVRVVNNYTITIYDVQIGSVQYGAINPGGTTDYVTFKDGSYNYSGNAGNGWSVTGTVTLPKKGLGHKHEWSLTLGINGSVSFVHDK